MDAYNRCAKVDKKILPILLTSMVEAEKFSDNPRSYWVSFPEVERPGRGVDHPPPPPSSEEVKERIELYMYFVSGPLWPCLIWT
jgi:hypothetical protein